MSARGVGTVRGHAESVDGEEGPDNEQVSADRAPGMEQRCRHHGFAGRTRQCSSRLVAFGLRSSCLRVSESLETNLRVAFHRHIKLEFHIVHLNRV